MRQNLPGRGNLREDWKIGKLENWDASLVTPGALRWARRGPGARVLHVFSGVCNLVNDEDEVLSLVTDQLDLGPFSVLAPESAVPFNRWLKQDTPIRVEPGAIVLGDHFLAFSAGEQWDPRIPWERLRTSPKLVLGRFPQLTQLLHRHAPENSLARLVGHDGASSNEPGEALSSKISHQIRAAARQPAADLCRGIVLQDLDAVRSGACALAGLGGGLTPAGDDYLVGAMLAAWLLYPARRASSVAETVINAAVPRTNRLSAAWLRAAAQGEASLRWHLLLEALSGPDLDGLEDAVLELLSVGHTSGADALGGFRDVLNLYKEARKA